MIKRTVLDTVLKKAFGADLLDLAREKDPENANGLQIAGRDSIRRVALGVSLTEDFLAEVIRAGADTVIVHHGARFEMPYQRLEAFAQKRLALLLGQKLNLYGFHFVLDAHRELGNNALIARALGARLVEPYFDQWGWVAALPHTMSVHALAKRLSTITSHDVFSVVSSQKRVKRLGVVSGYGIADRKERLEIVEKGVDVHITGEITEWMVHIFKELGVSYLAAGHYATEVFGVQELGKKIKEHFKDAVEVEFIDIPNPI